MALVLNPLTGNFDVVKDVTVGSPVVGGTLGSVLFIDGLGNIGEDNANFFWNDTNNRLGVGTNSPQGSLHVKSSSGEQLWLDFNGSIFSTFKVTNTPTSSLLIELPVSNNGLKIDGDTFIINSVNNWVGIGQTPSAKLHVEVSSIGEDNLLLKGIPNQVAALLLLQPGNPSTGLLIDGRNSINTPVFTIDQGGNIGIGPHPNPPLTVDNTGNITKIRNVTTSFPFSQGALNSILRNDGSGNLNWVDPSGTGSIGYWTRTGTTLYPTNITDVVGIGTSTAFEKLRVLGDVRVGANTPASYTTLTNDTTSLDTKILVTSTTGYPNFGVILINDEIIAYTGKTASEFTGCIRGEFGTIAQEHKIGDSVKTYSFMAVSTANIHTMVITSEGKIGLGVSDPKGKLHVLGGSQFGISTGILHITPDFIGVGEIPAGVLVGSLKNGSLTIAPSIDIGATTPKVVAAYYNGSSWFSAFEYSNVLGGGSNRSNLYLMKSGGNVGIGTTSASTNVVISESNADVAPALRVEQGSTGDATATFVLTSAGAWTIGIDNSDNDRFKIGQGSTDVGSNPVITIDPSGKVGVDVVNATAFLHVAASTTATSSLRLQAGVTPLTNSEGDIWVDSTQKALSSYVDGSITRMSGVVFVQAASITVVSTTIETSLIGFGVGTVVLPANFFVRGKRIRIKAKGYYGTFVVPGTLNIRIKLNSTVILTTGAQNAGVNLTNRFWQIEAEIDCRSVTDIASVMGQSVFDHNQVDLNTYNPTYWEMVNVFTIAIDPSISQTIGLTAQWGTANGRNTITCSNLSVEVLN